MLRTQEKIIMSYSFKAPANTDYSPLVPGVYPFCIIEVKEKTTKNGNAMIALTLECTEEKSGRNVRVYDNLVFTDSALFRVVQILRAIGKDIKEGDDVDLDPWDLDGKFGMVNIGVQPDYNDASKLRNCVKFYIDSVGKGSTASLPAQVKAAQRPQPAVDNLDDEIPF